MKKSRILLLFSLILLCYHTESAAQRSNIKDYVRIEITPDHDDWTYRTNEQASFTIRVIRGNVALKNIPLTYEIGPEKMPPVQTGKSRMEKGFLTVKAGTMKTPGFTTCLCRTEVDGIVYSNYEKIHEDGERGQRIVTVPPQVSYMELLKGNVIGNLTGIYDTEKVGKVYCSKIHHEDYVLWLSILKKGFVARNTNVVHALYRVRKQSVSANKLAVISWQWNIYRNVEKIGFLKACYYFIHYAWRALLKSKK